MERVRRPSAHATKKHRSRKLHFFSHSFSSSHYSLHRHPSGRPLQSLDRGGTAIASRRHREPGPARPRPPAHNRARQKPRHLHRARAGPRVEKGFGSSPQCETSPHNVMSEFGQCFASWTVDRPAQAPLCVVNPFYASAIYDAMPPPPPADRDRDRRTVALRRLRPLDNFLRRMPPLQNVASRRRHSPSVHPS